MDKKNISEKPKVIDPTNDIGNYVIQLKGRDGKVVKTVFGYECTVAIADVGANSLAVDIG